MQTRTYTERSNARRAARAAGLDPDAAVVACDDGFEVRFAPLTEAVNDVMEREPIHPLESEQSVRKSAADLEDGIPEFCKIAPEKRKQSWITNPPKAAAANLKEAITMAKTKAKEKKPKGSTGGDKNATLLKMLGGEGSTVESLCDTLGWLPHSLRARISRLNKPKSKGGEGLKVERIRADRITTYRIA